MFILLMALYFIANTTAKLLIRVLAQRTKLDPYAASLAIMAPTYVFGAIYGLLNQTQPLLQGVTPLLTIGMFLFGFLQVLSGKISMITQKHIETATYSVMRMLYVPISVLLSPVLFGESLNAQQFVGMVLILCGVSVVTTGGKMPRLKHFSKYEIFTLINSIFLGLYVVLNKYLLDQTSLATLMVVFSALENLPLLLTVAKKSRTKPTKLDLKLSTSIGLASAIHMLTFWLAVSAADNLALVSSLSAFRIVTIFLGGHYILKENGNFKQKIAGSLLAMTGLLLS